MNNIGAGLNRNSFQYFPLFFFQNIKTVQYCQLKVHQLHSIHLRLESHCGQTNFSEGTKCKNFILHHHAHLTRSSQQRNTNRCHIGLSITFQA